MAVEAVENVLNAFLGLFTRPFDQDLKASATAAATAISLAILVEGLSLSFSGEHGWSRALEMGQDNLVLVLGWITLTAAATRREHRKLAIARNLGVVSFWIAATFVFVLVAESLFPDELERTRPALTVTVLLAVFVPVHVFRSLPFNAAVGMTIALWFSSGFLVWKTFS